MIHVGGDLLDESIDTLRSRLDAEDPSTEPRVDLSEVRFVQAAGARLLAEAQSRGFELFGASPYIELLIDRYRQSRPPQPESAMEPSVADPTTGREGER